MRTTNRRTIREATVAEQFAYIVRKDGQRHRLTKFIPVILLAAMSLVFSVISPSFLSIGNINNLLYQMSIPLILATGITFVLLIGSIDLSLEGVMGFAGSACALLLANTKNANDMGALGIIITIAACVLFGALTGFLHTKLKIASFIITFAMGNIASGFAVLTYRSNPATIKCAWADYISMHDFLGIPYLTWIALAVFALGCVLLYCTSFGRSVYAVGDNEAACRASGINVDLVKILVYSISGCVASIGGIISLIRLKIGQVSIGTDQLFPTITALVIAGTSMTGGKGGMLQTFIGVLIYTELENFLTIVGVDSYYKKAIQGIVIIVAVALTVSRDRKTISK